ncbi:MAG: hypothetical protein IKH14_06980 [Prevotella sp.]|nr:hypothetical protein [Prevotella sp.]
MINAIVEQLTNKTIDEYKVIEDRYYTLRRFLLFWFDHHYTLGKDDLNVILNALEPFEIEGESEEINND